VGDHGAGVTEHARFDNERQHVDAAPAVPRLLRTGTLVEVAEDYCFCESPPGAA